MRIERIENLEDPRVAVYRDVADAALRDERGLFVVESRLCVRRLLGVGRYAVHSIFVSDAALAGLRDALEELNDRPPIYVAAAAILNGVVGYNLHRGCIAAAERGEARAVDEILASEPRLLVGLEAIANPENVGNVFRNALAFGAAGVLLSNGCADPLYRKAIRVSMGATLRVPFARVSDWPRALEELRAVGFTTAALSTDPGAMPLADFGREGRVPQRIALIFGAEGEGLRGATAAAAELRLRIPMAAGIDSLNVATASGVALHHCAALLGGPNDAIR